MVDIECLVCGKAVKIPQYVDTEKYEGQVACQECNSLLYVKLVKGKVQKYKIVENKSKSFNWAELVKSVEEARKRQEKEEP